jgi:hypothetical protein
MISLHDFRGAEQGVTVPSLLCANLLSKETSISLSEIAFGWLRHTNAEMHVNSFAYCPRGLIFTVVS